MNSMPCFSLQDKVVVVTGAGRGIGRTIANDAQASGAFLAVGSRTEKEISELSERIKAKGGQCFWHVVDVTMVESIERFVSSVIDHYGRIDVLINNAGYNKQKPLMDYSEQEFDQIVDANLKSVFFFSQAVARHMVRSGEGGAIVNLSSQAGVVGAPNRGPYSGAKAGVNNLTRTMAAEWAVHGIRVNAVAPTVTRSPMAEQAMKENPAFRDDVKTKNLLRGDLALPEEISAPVIFLASSAASMITGHTLVVDGGWTIT